MRYQAALRPDRKTNNYSNTPAFSTDGHSLKGAQEVRRSPRGHGCPIGEHAIGKKEGVSLVTFFAPAKKVTCSRSE
jgi:hypothetical protein